MVVSLPLRKSAPLLYELALKSLANITPCFLYSNPSPVSSVSRLLGADVDPRSGVGAGEIVGAGEMEGADDGEVVNGVPAMHTRSMQYLSSPSGKLWPRCVPQASADHKIKSGFSRLLPTLSSVKKLSARFASLSLHAHPTPSDRPSE